MKEETEEALRRDREFMKEFRKKQKILDERAKALEERYRRIMEGNEPTTREQYISVRGITYHIVGGIVPNVPTFKLPLNFNTPHMEDNLYNYYTKTFPSPEGELTIDFREGKKTGIVQIKLNESFVKANGYNSLRELLDDMTGGYENIKATFGNIPEWITVIEKADGTTEFGFMNYAPVGNA